MFRGMRNATTQPSWIHKIGVLRPRHEIVGEWISIQQESTRSHIRIRIRIRARRAIVVMVMVMVVRRTRRLLQRKRVPRTTATITSADVSIPIIQVRTRRIQAMIRFRAVAHELDEFTQDGEFELELDAVDDAFERGFDEVEVCEFDGEEGEIHGYYQHVDGEELVHCFADAGLFKVRVYGSTATAAADAAHVVVVTGGGVVETAGVVLNSFGEFEQSDCFFDVDYREDCFLYEEADHLCLFHYRVAADEALEGGPRERVGV